ncbi:hypothetical protein QTP86_022044, partial [Hemibagrus guttatus]
MVLIVGSATRPQIVNKVDEDREDLVLPEGAVVLQYADDLLISAETADICKEATWSLLNHLAQQGFKVSLSKLQFFAKQSSVIPSIDFTELQSFATPSDKSIGRNVMLMLTRVVFGFSLMAVFAYLNPPFHSSYASSTVFHMRTKGSDHGYKVHKRSYFPTGSASVAIQIYYFLGNAMFPQYGVVKLWNQLEVTHFRLATFVNETLQAMEGVRSELTALRLTASQNRMALDMILAEKGGVCAVIGDSCCTFIPDHDDAHGEIGQAVDKMRKTAEALKEDEKGDR